MKTVPVTTYYLEMTAPERLSPSTREIAGLEIIRAEIPSPELNRFLYTSVGGDWYWLDRLSWTIEQWTKYLDRPELETWTALFRGTPAGYFELERQAEGNIELAYFGLLPRFIGLGIGGVLLTKAAERAWEMGARRFWVHTCTLDSQAALPAYQARGFEIYREETADVTMPERSPGPWPGAR